MEGGEKKTFVRNVAAEGFRREKFQEEILLMVKMKNEEVEVLQNLSRVHQSHGVTHQHR